MVVFRGVNIYPGKVDEVLSRIDGVGSEYRVSFERKEDGKDYMTVQVERARHIGESTDGAAGTGAISPPPGSRTP